MSGVKIQINNLEALERLFGIKDGEDISIELRGNIVQEFTNKHLKGIANDDAIKKAILEVKDNIALRVNDALVTKGSYQTMIRSDVIKRLDEYIKNEIERHLKSILDGPVKEAVKKAVDELKDEEDNWLYLNASNLALHYAFEKMKKIIESMSDKIKSEDYRVTLNGMINGGK